MSKKSIVNIHSGQAGCQIAWELWDLYCFEHNIGMDGKRIADKEILGQDQNNFNTFFYETSSGTYVPKTILIDSDPSVIDAIRASPLGTLIHDRSLISGFQDCRNCFGLAFLDDFCSEVHSLIPDSLRHIQECADNLSGYMYFLSSCGGSGPGFTTRTLMHVRESQPKSINHSNVLLPSPTLSQNPMETLNAITYLGMIRYDNHYMNVNTVFDNEALYRQSIRLNGNQKFQPSFCHLNQLIAMNMSSVTASIRWDGQLNVDMEDIQVNLVPYPTMHHLFTTYAPLNNSQAKDRIRTVDLTLQAFRPHAHCVSVNCMADCMKWSEEEEVGNWEVPIFSGDAEATKSAREAQTPPIKTLDNCYAIKHGFIGCALLYRGDVMPVKINKAVRELNKKYNPYFVSWVPNGFKIGINSPPLETPDSWSYLNATRSLTCLINSTVIIEKIKHLVRDYRIMREKNCYNNWYDVTGKRFTPEFTEACKEGLKNLITQYEAAMSRTLGTSEMRDAMGEKPDPITQLRNLA